YETDAPLGLFHARGELRQELPEPVCRRLQLFAPYLLARRPLLFIRRRLAAQARGFLFEFVQKPHDRIPDSTSPNLRAATQPGKSGATECKYSPSLTALAQPPRIGNNQKVATPFNDTNTKRMPMSIDF